MPFAFLSQLAKEETLRILDSYEIAERPEQTAPVPTEIRNFLSDAWRDLCPKQQLWRHQAKALEHLLKNENVAIVTGTASGKSLVFQLYTLAILRINPDARIIVFYPLKALAGDQERRWRQAVEAAGLEPDIVGRIDGGVDAQDRSSILQRARILLLTPDVCQAWLMRQCASESVRKVLRDLDLIVLDEAHVYESVFGSNTAFLIRRLRAAAMLARAEHRHRRTQLIAASATIDDPETHLHRLTGERFTVVGENENGAPRHRTIITHLAAPSQKQLAMEEIIKLIRHVHELEHAPRFIVFYDSRQGAEQTVFHADLPNVLPYRSGYEAEDRQKIERELREGNLRGVVATSALELGIDIPDLEIGINFGVPPSRKAFWQRLGRVGRARPGVFCIFAPPGAFANYGTSFQGYIESGVEPSLLYLGNRFIQYMHARCLRDEMESLGASLAHPPKGISWPEGFERVWGYLGPHGRRPREFDHVAQLGADAPHLNYGLRSVGEPTIDIRVGRGGHEARLGTISSTQALREAYPGATYFHLGRPYKVRSWSRYGGDWAIRVDATQKAAPTRPIFRTFVTVPNDPSDIIAGRFHANETGWIAEQNIRVYESVDGFSIGGKRFYYKDLRSENPNMNRKHRDFWTTGVVINIDEAWFAGSDRQISQARQRLAKALTELLCRKRGISPYDVDWAASNLSYGGYPTARRMTSMIVIYDTVYGGLRLTEDVFLHFQDHLAHLAEGAELALEGAMLTRDFMEKLQRWAITLSPSEVAPPVTIPAAPEGWLAIYKPGSVVGVRIQGQLVERRILQPVFADLLGDGEKILAYAYETDSPNGRAFVLHDQVEPVGDDWQFVFWNPETGEMKELEEHDANLD